MHRGLSQRVIAGTTSVVVIAATVTVAGALPAFAADCADGTISSDSSCTIPGTLGFSRNVILTLSGGGGGSNDDGGNEGGAGARVSATMSVPAGATLNSIIGQGGGNDPDGAGGGGGGSSAFTISGVVLMEAGGGGSASRGADGGSGGDTDGAGFDAPDGGNTDPCEAAQTNGKGANKTGNGAGGVAGTATGCDPWWGRGTNGIAFNAASAPGAGGVGGSSDGSTSLPPGGGASGGVGFHDGGDGGADATGGGGGGGGGYGGGGAGVGTASSWAGAGGGGGSYVNPNYAVSDAAYSPTGGAGGDESPGDPGEAELQFIDGPLAQTEASAPTSITKTSATLHSSVNANGNPTLSITVRVSASPTFASGVRTATIMPTSATGSSDTAITGTIDGLTQGTTYYYQVIAVNSIGTVNGLVESFQTEGTPVVDNACPLSVVGARPTSRRLPVAKPVVLTKAIQTVPQCELHIRTNSRYGRGDVRGPVRFVVNSKTGRVIAIARSANARARLRARATPVKSPYTRPSHLWQRAWTS